MTESEIIFDKAQLNELKVLLDDGFNDFVNVYFQDFEIKEKELSTAIENHEIEAVAKIAHTLKGSSSSIGASSLAMLCSQIEAAGKKGNFAEVLTEYQVLQKLYPKYKEELLRFTR